MLTDKEINNLSQALIDIYAEIELEMIQDVAKRFDTYDEIGGTQEWRLKKLDELGALNASTLAIMARFSKKTREAMKEAIEGAMMGNFDKQEINKAYKKGDLEMDLDTLKKSKHWRKIYDHSYKDISKQLKLINTKALESQKKEYTDVLNKAYIETSTGFKSYDQAIHDALIQFAKTGITGATYRRKLNNGKVKTVHYSLEGTVRRDVVTAVNSTSNRASVELAKDMGYTHVEVSQHLGARTGKTKWSNHAGWQGKVYKIEDLEKETGYGHIEGLGGVNCRHRTFPFIVGISKPKNHIDEAENAEFFQNEKEQRKLEREIRDLRKQWEVIKRVGTLQEKRDLKKQILDKNKEIDSFVKSHEGLKRQFNREVVTEHKLYDKRGIEYKQYNFTNEDKEKEFDSVNELYESEFNGYKNNAQIICSKKKSMNFLNPVELEKGKYMLFNQCYVDDRVSAENVKTNKPLRQIILHEQAHDLTNQIALHRLNYEVNTSRIYSTEELENLIETVDKVSNRIQDAVRGDMAVNVFMDNVRKQLSGRALFNSRELIAESFADYYLNKKPSEISIKVVDEFKKVWEEEFYDK